jgi:hypothetical protein
MFKPIYKTVKVWDEKAMGDEIRAWRLSRECSLRNWCKLLLLDPSNYSRAERGLGGMTPLLLQRINVCVNSDWFEVELRKLKNIS